MGRFLFSSPRKWTSLALVGLAAGWIIPPLWDLGLMVPKPYAPLRWAGAVIFTVVLWTVTSAERIDPDGPRK